MQTEKYFFFFSLKSGSLYDSHFDTNVIQILKSLNDYLEESLEGTSEEEQIVVLRGLQEKIRSHKGISKNDLEKLSGDKKEQLIADLEKELSKNVTHVGKTFSGIELVHFCANNAYDELWEKYELPQPIGVVVFWRFIVSKIIEARNILGVHYLFLFAADLSEEDSLIRYYSDKLDFLHDGERATVKPIYDLSCEFMYQETKDLEERQRAFFENFNPDIEEV